MTGLGGTLTREPCPLTQKECHVLDGLVMNISALPSPLYYTQSRSVAVTGCATRRNDDECPNCAKFGSQSVFDSAQESQCRDEPRAIEAIAQGMRHSIVDCQVRFNHSRWNCSTFYGSDLFGYFVAHSEFD